MTDKGSRTCRGWASLPPLPALLSGLALLSAVATVPAAAADHPVTLGSGPDTLFATLARPEPAPPGPVPPSC